MAVRLQVIIEGRLLGKRGSGRKCFNPLRNKDHYYSLLKESTVRTYNN